MPRVVTVGERVLLGAGAAAGALIAVLAARIYANGYGADNDTWLMLGTWDVLVDEHRYVPSRPPGYLLPEVVIGATADVGGHWLSNLVSLVLSATTVALVHGVVRRRTGEAMTAWLLVAVLVATPAFAIASVTSIDYVYGLCGFVAAWTVLETDRPAWLGGLLLGVAAVSRLTYAPLGLIVALLGPGRRRPPGDRGVAIAVLAGVTLAGYVPSWRFAGDLSFLTAERPTGQGLAGLLGRAVVKGGDLLGVVGSIAAVVVAVLVSRRAPRRDGGEPWLLVLAGAVLAIWLWIPVEPSYLLPGLVAVLVWVARPGLDTAVRRGLALLVAALVLYGVVDVRVAEVEYANRYGVDTCDATEATEARWRPHVTAGVLLGYPDTSERVRSCNELQRAGQAQRRPG